MPRQIEIKASKPCEIKRVMPSIECTSIGAGYYFINDKKFGDILVCSEHWNLLYMNDVVTETRKKRVPKD